MLQAERFGAWVRQQRKAAGMTQRECSTAIGWRMDRDMGGSWSQLENGRYPCDVGRILSSRIGRLFGCEDEALLVAGFAPEGLFEALTSDRDWAPLDLDPDLRAALLDLAALPEEQRRGAEVFLRAATAGVRSERGEVA